MGIQINGNTNNINAGIGSLSIEDINELDIVGVATASNFKTGVSNLHNVGLTLSGGQIDVGSNIKIGTAGVVTATTFSGSGASLTNLPAGNLTGALPAISGANLTGLPAGTTINGNTDHYVVTATGTANTLQGESTLTFNNGQLDVTQTTSSSDAKVVIRNSNTPGSGSLRLEFHYGTGNTEGTDRYRFGYVEGYRAGGSNDGGLKFGTKPGNADAPTERLRINPKGQISIRGTTTAFDTTGDLDSLQLYYETDSGQASIGPYTGGGSTHLSFYTNSGGAAATEKLRIASSGQVEFHGGDGGTDAIKVQSEAGGGAIYISNFRGVTDTGDTTRLGVGKNNNALIFMNASGSQVDTFAIGNTDSVPLVFSTANTERLRIEGGGIVKITGNSSGQLNLRRSTSTDQEAIFYYGSSSLEIETREATSIFLKTNKQPRVKIQADGNVGIARTTNNVQTSSTNSLYNLSINRESNAHAYENALNKSLNVDNQYTVQTFRSTNTNRNGTQAWFDVAHFRAWDINARVIIQAGGTFTGDQINIDVQSSYNSALGTGRAGPVLEVKRTEGHSGGRFTKVRIGCAANRQPILQVYFDGNATHNSAGSINVTVHDYGSNYGNGAHRGEAKFATATSLTETWESLDIDQPHCDYFNTSTTPAFSVFKADNSNQIGSGVYAFNSQILDRGGDNYNTSNGKFTAPCDGVYYFIATLQMYGGSSTVHARFQKNGVDVYNNGTNTPYYDEKHSAHANLQPFCLVELSTDDYVECVRNGNTRGMQSAMIGFLVR